MVRTSLAYVQVVQDTLEKRLHSTILKSKPTAYSAPCISNGTHKVVALVALRMCSWVIPWPACDTLFREAARLPGTRLIIDA